MRNCRLTGIYYVLVYTTGIIKLYYLDHSNAVQQILSDDMTRKAIDIFCCHFFSYKAFSSHLLTVQNKQLANINKNSICGELFLNLTRDLTQRKRISSGGFLVFLMYLSTAMLNSAAMSLYTFSVTNLVVPCLNIR